MQWSETLPLIVTEQHSPISSHFNNKHKICQKNVHISALLFSVVEMSCTGAVFVFIDKAWDVIRRDGDDKRIGDHSQYTNSFKNSIPYT